MLNINNYTQEGFVKVYDVTEDYNGHWYYKNIDKTIMYAEHKSWVYFIVVDEEIVKIGETGNPLGIQTLTENQPIKGTTSRLGRYRSGDGTDAYIRQELKNEVTQGRVSIWARKCDIVQVQTIVGGNSITSTTTLHKSLEQDYLKHIVEHTRSLPKLNKSHK